MSAMATLQKGNIPERLQALRADLEAGRISPQTAIETYDALTNNLFVSAWWKKARAARIKSKCEQCGATEGPMVLQHFSHPPSLGELRRPAWKRYKRVIADPTWAGFVGSMEWQVPIVVRLIAARLAYLSMDETETFCRKCAYLWDKKGTRLCRVCKTKYHKHKWDTCLECHLAGREESGVSECDCGGGEECEKCGGHGWHYTGEGDGN